MKKTLTLAAALVASAAFAQFTVTYQVDITDYPAGRSTLGANGMRHRRKLGAPGLVLYHARRGRGIGVVFGN